MRYFGGLALHAVVVEAFRASNFHKVAGNSCNNIKLHSSDFSSFPKARAAYMRTNSISSFSGWGSGELSSRSKNEMYAALAVWGSKRLARMRRAAFAKYSSFDCSTNFSKADLPWFEFGLSSIIPRTSKRRSFPDLELNANC